MELTIEEIKNKQYFENCLYCVNDNNNIIEKQHKSIMNMHIQLTDYCNLKCWACTSFCPLVSDKNFLSIYDIINTLKNVVKFRDNIKTIIITGGESTLHPKINEILHLVRAMFPNNEIRLFTNGTTYNNIHKIKDSIVQNNIVVVVTKYPIEKLDNIVDTYTEILPKENLILNDFPMKYGFSNLHLQKYMHYEIDKIMQCYNRHYCTMIENNKLYMCQYGRNIKHLKNRFPEVDISEIGSYMEINENTTINDILDFLNSIPRICYHCASVLQEDLDKNYKIYRTFGWKKSEEQLSEFYRE